MVFFISFKPLEYQPTLDVYLCLMFVKSAFDKNNNCIADICHNRHNRRWCNS